MIIPSIDISGGQAVQLVGGEPTFRWHKGHELGNPDLVVLPGGFSYGDYLRAGAIARFSPIMEEVAAFARRGGLVLGICNGFQILCEAGLLPGALIKNDTLKFEGIPVRVRSGERLRFSVAVGRGGVSPLLPQHPDERVVTDGEQPPSRVGALSKGMPSP